MASVILTASVVGLWVAVVGLLLMHLRLARQERSTVASIGRMTSITEQIAATLGHAPADSTPSGTVRHLRVVTEEEHSG